MRDSNSCRPDSQKPSWCKLRKFCWLWSCCGCLPWCCFFFIKTRPTSVTSASNRQKQFYKWHQMSSSPLRNRTRCTVKTTMPIRLKCNYWTVPWSNAFWPGLTPFGPPMWQTEAGTELTLSASPTTAVGQKALFHGNAHYSLKLARLFWSADERS